MQLSRKTLRYKEHNNFFCDTDFVFFFHKTRSGRPNYSYISIRLNTTKNFIAKRCRDHRC